MSPQYTHSGAGCGHLQPWLRGALPEGMWSLCRNEQSPSNRLPGLGHFLFFTNSDGTLIQYLMFKIIYFLALSF